MGYETRHMLSIMSEPNTDNTKKIEGLKVKITETNDYEKIMKIAKEITRLDDYNLEKEIEFFISEDENFRYAISYLDEFGEGCKWYSHEDDMRKFSIKFKVVLFELSGEGEESGDVWKEYYKNGKMQRCKAELVFSEYDELKLK